MGNLIEGSVKAATGDISKSLNNTVSTAGGIVSQGISSGENVITSGISSGENIITQGISSGEEVTKRLIGGVEYTVVKSIDKAGDVVTNIYKNTAGSLVLMYTDTERNIIKTLNNSQLLISNAYQSTQENIIFGIRSPLEKVIHVFDNHLDQWEQIANNFLNNAFEIGDLTAWMIFYVIILFFLIFGKEVIIQLIDLVKSFKISFQ